MSKVSAVKSAFIGRAAMVVLAWLLLVTSALAHASLTAAEPRDGAVMLEVPTKLALSFSEPVSPLALKLIKPDGSSIQLEQFSLKDRTVEIEAPHGLGQGTHVLSWRVVSEDGHPVGGSVVFSIGAPSASSSAAEADNAHVRALVWAARVMLYAGLGFGIGGVFATNWFLRGNASGRRFITTMLGIGFAGTLFSAGLQGVDALGAPLASFLELRTWSTGLATSYGRTVFVMTAALVLAALALLPRLRPFAAWLSLAALIAGSLALSLSGHASAAEPQWLMRPSVFLHAMTIAVWVGALVPLASLLRSRQTLGMKALHRFSVSVPVVVGILVAVGVVLAVVQVEQPSALFSTAYGRVFLVKLALLVPLFALAAINRWLLTAPTQSGDRLAALRLVRVIAAETLVVLLVFGVAATWRFTPPPRAIVVAAAQPASVHIHGSKAMAEVTLTPGRAGSIQASIFVMAGDFSPLDAKEITLVFENTAAGVEQIRRKANKAADGNWQVPDLVLPLPGTWKVRVDILINDFEVEKISGEIQIQP